MSQKKATPPFSKEVKKKRPEPKTRQPHTWTPEKVGKAFEEILRLISIEGLALCKAVKEPNTCSLDLFYEYLNGRKDETLTAKQIEVRQERYAHACNMRADALFEKIIEIANAPVMGEEVTTETGHKGGGTITKKTKKEMLGHRRLQIDAIKWSIGKMRPEKYGDRQTVKHEGEIATTDDVDLSELTTEELKAYRDIKSKISKK